MFYRDGNKTTTAYSCTALADRYVYFLAKFWVWLDMALFSLIPFVIAVSCSVAIVYKVSLFTTFFFFLFFYFVHGQCHNLPWLFELSGDVLSLSLIHI